MRTSILVVAAAAAVSSFLPRALAQHGGDILLDLEDSGAIRTNLLEASGKVEVGARVFPAEFGEAAPDFTDEPGFDSVPGTFAPGSAIGFVIRDALRAWNGVDFGAVPVERIEVAFATLGPVLTPLDSTPVTGFTLPVGANGQWHRHLEYTLGAPAGDGVYLLELGLFSTDAGVGDSLSFWLVFNQNAPEEEHDAAVAWASENLVVAPCRADYNGDGAANSQDFFDFLGSFFEGDADFNADGMTNSQDLFDFLTVFFSGC